MLTGLNHITLAVKDLDTSLDFYTKLGFKLRMRWAKGAYLEVGDTWVCLALGASTATAPRGDYTHLAFSTTPEGIERLEEVVSTDSLWHQNKSEGASLYFTDPDGHKLEAHVGDLHSRLEHLTKFPFEELEIYDS